MKKHIVIIGPSGSGKTTLQRALVDFGWKAAVQYTTRPMRPSETDGFPYHFSDDREFDQLVDDGWLSLVREYRVWNGQTWRYGSPISDLRANDQTVSVLDPSGYLELKDMIDDVYGVYMDIPEDVIRYRLLARGDKPEEIDRRIKADFGDFAYIRHNFSNVCDLRINTVRKPSQDAERIINYINAAERSAKKS